MQHHEDAILTLLLNLKKNLGGSHVAKSLFSQFGKFCIVPAATITLPKSEYYNHNIHKLVSLETMNAFKKILIPEFTIKISSRFLCNVFLHIYMHTTEISLSTENYRLDFGINHIMAR